MPIIDESLSRGLVRAETRDLRNALRQHTGDVLKTFHEGVFPHFEKGKRLSVGEVQDMANDLHENAKAAFTPLWCDMELDTSKRRGTPSISYEMLHYWINPVEVEGTSDRLLKVAVFSAWGDRKQTAMRAHDTLVSFYEHAAQRLLQRFDTREAAVRAIGQRLVETMIVPTLALHEAPASLAGTEMHIPFMDGLLLGRFVERPVDAVAGDYKRIWKLGWQTWAISFPTTAEFLVKTYIGPAEMSDRQQWIAFEVEAWLAAHRREGETIRRYVTYKLGTLWDNGHLAIEDFEALKADFWRMRNKVFGPLPQSSNI